MLRRDAKGFKRHARWAVHDDEAGARQVIGDLLGRDQCIASLEPPTPAR
jgi:hypothetical protein